MDLLRKAEQLGPNARSELLLAISYQQLKQMDLANQYLELAQKRAPNDPDVERTMAGYYREIRKLFRGYCRAQVDSQSKARCCG